MFQNIKLTALNLYKTLTIGKQKAITAFVVAAVGTYVSRHGWKLNMTLSQALQALVVGAVAHVSVYTTRNK